MNQNKIAELIQSNQEKIITEWLRILKEQAEGMYNSLGSHLVHDNCVSILRLFSDAFHVSTDIDNPSYAKIKERLSQFSASMTIKNVSPTETALIVFALKQSIHQILLEQVSKDDQIAFFIAIDRIIDKLGLFTFKAYVDSKERTIHEQQKRLLEVSVPVVKIWNRIIMIPLVGILDSTRTKLMMETLLEAIESTQSQVAILDISGIPIVDTLVARHLIMTVSATKLMGAECIISGVNAKISQTIVQLGIDLSGIITRTKLADALKLALDVTNQSLVSKEG